MYTLAGWWTQPRGNLSPSKRNQGLWTFSESETWSLQEEPVLGRPISCKKGTGESNASRKSDHPGSPKAEGKQWSHNPHVSPATVHHTEAVFSIVKEIYGREHDDPMDDLDVNMAVWGIFLNATLRAAVHLGQDYEANLRYVKSHLWSSVGLLFRKTGKLISEQKEITGIKDYRFPRSHVDADQLIMWKGSSDHQRQNLRLLRLCALCGKNERWSYCDLEDQNNIVFGKQSLQVYESNRWYANGVRVEHFPRNQQRWASSRRFKV